MTGVTWKLNARVGAETAPPLNLVESPLTGRARITPMMPAANASAEDSARNDVMMASGLNPNARNVPISVHRADTAAYIVFIAAKMAAKAMIPATNNPSTRRLAGIMEIGRAHV